MRTFLVAILHLTPCAALAHPVDQVSQGAYLTLSPGKVALELDIVPGAEVAGAIVQALDADADKSITRTEARAFAQTVLDRSALLLDGVAASWTLGDVNVPGYATLLSGNDLPKITATADRPDSAGAHELRYENAYAPAKTKRAANIFLLPGGGWQY